MYYSFEPGQNVVVSSGLYRGLDIYSRAVTGSLEYFWLNEIR